MISDSAKRANAKYVKSHYDDIKFRIPSGGRAVLADFAKSHDSSTNAYLLRALRQCLLDDGASPDTIRAICGDMSGVAR